MVSRIWPVGHSSLTSGLMFDSLSVWAAMGHSEWQDPDLGRESSNTQAPRPARHNSFLSTTKVARVTSGTRWLTFNLMEKKTPPLEMKSVLWGLIKSDLYTLYGSTFPLQDKQNISDVLLSSEARTWGSRQPANTLRSRAKCQTTAADSKTAQKCLFFSKEEGFLHNSHWFL